ncbi:5-hydroxytryptamine receptor 3A [Oryzias melastigma]|nr:5-hydroxytryptamine receptor 3A [Oryzias melastigma]
MKIFGILDVREADQMFVSFIWVKMSWNNEYIQWDPDQFCGQKHILVPTKYLWMPDLTIEEMTERDKTAPSPNLNIRHDGWVDYRNGQVVESTCAMDVFRFPFDIQACQISFKSITYSDEELSLVYNRNKTGLTRNIRKTIQTQSEWSFHNFKVHEETVDYFGFNQTVIVYTITLKRLSDRYVANFLVPVFFLLCLDFASFLVLDTSGEKIGFKVNMLLAMTLMQVILNEILPPSTGSVPLIGRYCVGIFTLMMLSLLETILVIYLKNKDQIYISINDENQKLNENLEDKRSSLQCCCRGMNKWIHSASAEDTAKEDQYFPKEGSSGPHTEVSLVLEKVHEELGEIRKFQSLLNSRTAGYWTSMAEKINKAFIVFYIVVAVVSMSFIFTVWILGDE